MARKVYIDIADHSDACTMHYTVSYRLSGTGPGWQHTERQYTSPIILTNIEDGQSYDYEIVRTCCTGGDSTALSGSFTADVIPEPPNWLISQSGGPGSAVEFNWDAVVGADGYELERADDEDFTTNVVQLYNGATNSYTETPPPTPGFYWYRLRTLAGGLASKWSVVDYEVL